MIVDELGHAHLQRGRHAHQRARARALRRRASSRATASGVMCRNHRGFIEATIALSKLGADALYLNTAFAGPQLVEVVQREKPKALIFDEEFYELLEEAGHRRKRFVAWHDSPTCHGPDARRADGGRRPEHGGAAGARGPGGDPHLRHDRHAEGRVARQPGVDRPGGGLPLEDPAEEPLHDPRRRAAVPLVGLRALLARPDPRHDVRAAAEVRSRGLPRRGGPLARGRARRGAGDDAAHPRAARGDDREVRHLVAEGRGARAARRCPATSPRAGWTASATRSTTCTARPRSRGPRSRRPPTCAPRPARPAGRRAARS